MPKISEARREERRAQILDAALRCFVRGGYQRTSMADIITESELSAGAIYSYFPSKAQLVRAVAGSLLADRRADLAVAGSTHVLSPAEIATILVAGIRRDAPLTALVQVWGEATVDAELRALVQDTIGGMRDALVDALSRWATAHPERVPVGSSAREWSVASAPVLMSLIPGFVLQRAMFPDFDEDAFIRAIALVLPASA